MKCNFFLQIYISSSAQENSHRSPGNKIYKILLPHSMKNHIEKSHRNRRIRQDLTNWWKLLHIAHIASYTISLKPIYQMPTCYRLSLVTRWPTNHDLDSRLSLVRPTFFWGISWHTTFVYIHTYIAIQCWGRRAPLCQGPNTNWRNDTPTTTHTGWRTLQADLLPHTWTSDREISVEKKSNGNV